ncbi:MAG: GNAT family N-acetyltransferase [Verrucomicrobiota bacterium]
MSLTIRPLAASELGLAIEWAAAEGWNPGQHDALAFHAADPDGFLVGELPSSEPVGVISAVRTGDDFGFIGFYIVAPGHRGRGHGLRLWNAAMERLAGRTIGLDGVVAQQANYARSGFTLAHRNLRYGGTAPAAATLLPPDVVDAHTVPFGQLVAFDAARFGRPRPAFLRAWIDLPDSRALVIVRNGEIRGFGQVRRCRAGCKIGPLFAGNEADADALFTALAGYAPGEPLFLDPPEPNAAAVALARRHGLEPVFETARMYRGPAPALPLEQIYGITSFELG